MVSSALPITPPRLACPPGREVFIGNVIANVNLPFTAWNETLLPAGQAGEGSRIGFATSNLKTSAHVGQDGMYIGAAPPGCRFHRGLGKKGLGAP